MHGQKYLASMPNCVFICTGSLVIISYIKMDARDHAFVLSEVVFWKLSIVQYHPNVEVWRGGLKS